MVKHIHSLTVNTISKNACKYLYQFGSTKNIELVLSETGFSITANLNRIYDKEEMLSGKSYLFPDAIKKGLLLHLIKYNRALSIKSITVKIDINEETIKFDKTVKPPIYSMVTGDLVRIIPPELSSDIVFDYLLHTPKSNYDKRIASLFALLCSKSKSFETERFLYLWTSFNGIYSWISEFVAKNNGFDRYRKEYKQIIAFQKYFDVGNETINEDDKSRIAHSVITILKRCNREEISQELLENSELGKNITAILVKSNNGKYDITAYGYLLTQLSYYFRCKYVHGSKPVLLFAYPDDDELHSLSIINNLLEVFIDKTLHLLFDDDYINNTLIPKAKTIKLK